MNRPHFYYVAYGFPAITVKLSPKCREPENAMKYCFGTIDYDKMTIKDIGTLSPRYMSDKDLSRLIEELRIEHTERMGQIVRTEDSQRQAV